MRKLLLLIAGLVLLPGISFASDVDKSSIFDESSCFTIAASVKLGQMEEFDAYEIGTTQQQGGNISCNPETCTKGKRCVNDSCLNCSFGEVCGCPSGQISSELGTCIACPANATCSGGNVTCAIGYYKSGRSCIKCPTGCTACSNASTCTGCASGYLKSGNNCYSCPENANCSGGTTFTCQTGYKVSSGGSSGTYGATCVPTCYSCSGSWQWCAGEGGTTCTTSSISNGCTKACNGDLFPFSCDTTTCAQVGGTYRNGYCSKDCGGSIACASPGVSSYDPRGCVDSCPSGCTTCKTYQQCTGCVSPTHFLDYETCKTCPANATCNGTKNFTCGSGYFKDNSTCTQCDSKCTVCSSATKCTQCTSGNYYNNSTCVACPANGSCTGGTTSFTCNAGYYKGTDMCLSCPTACSACTKSGNNISCSSCNAGYYKDRTSCKTCPAFADCPGGTGKFTCSEGYKAQGSECVYNG